MEYPYAAPPPSTATAAIPAQIQPRPEVFVFGTGVVNTVRSTVDVLVCTGVGEGDSLGAGDMVVTCSTSGVGLAMMLLKGS